VNEFYLHFGVHTFNFVLFESLSESERRQRQTDREKNTDRQNRQTEIEINRQTEKDMQR